MTVLTAEDVEVHLNALQTMTEQFQLCEWRHCSLGKLHCCSEITSESLDGCTWSPNLSTYSLTVIRPWRVIMGPTEFYTTILLPKPSLNLPRVSLLEPGIPDCRPPWVFPKRKLFLMLETACRTSHLTTSLARFQLSDVHVLWPWHHCLSIWALPSVIRGLAIAALPWILDLWSSD
jgi:hypothetical protein